MEGSDHAALRRGKLDVEDVGLIIWEMEIAEHFKWKDTAD
jgi:hypothetical protein